jgi:acetyl esterase/lipase
MHGGGYVSCSAATHRPITAALARLTGRRVFSLDYRLAPEHRFPAALDDAVAAYRWILESQGVDPTELAVAGDSAGGGLTLALLVKARELGLPMPACAVCFSAWTDLAGAGQSLKDNADSDAMFRPENISAFAGAYLGTTSDRDPLASPVYASLEGLPSILLHVGSTEILLDDSRRVNEAILRAGGTCSLKVFEDVSHGWQVLKGIVPEAAESLNEAAAFIDEAITRRIVEVPAIRASR